MKNNFLQEIFVSLVLIVLLVLLLNPFSFWMPTTLLMMMVLGLVVVFVVFVVFASFVWRENERDEREGFHKMMAGRIAFLVGTAILIVGIIVESFEHKLNPWLVLALGGMILAKIIGLMYNRIRR